MNIVLIGYRGSGKTTIGKMLAKRLKMKFIDSDKAVEKEAGKSINEIFSTQGEKKFREYERKAISGIAKLDGCVIACGGGVVLSKANMKKLKKNSVVIYLEANVDSICRRIKGSKRPKLTKKKRLEEEVEEMLAKRIPLYEEYSDFSVDGNNSPEKVLNEIIMKIKWAMM